MAHSYITSFEREIDAFRAFAQAFPENTVLLVDTYDTIQGAIKAAEVGKEMAKKGQRLKAVRLDSGDMAKLSQKVRKILKDSGLHDATIFASGGFDEYKIQKVFDQGADIDSFGVGTKMGVSADAPYLDMAYKLVKFDGRPVLKLSPGKMTLPSEKQIFRFFNPDGKMERDIIGLRDDQFRKGAPLLEKVMDNGKIISQSLTLPQIQGRFLEEFSKLDDKYKAIKGKDEIFPVDLSPRLKSLQEEVIQKVKKEELKES